MSEIALQNKLMAILKAGRDECQKIWIFKSTSDAATITDLIGSSEFDVKPEESLLKPHSQLSRDMFGGQEPDLALISKSSGQVRVLIEVKQFTDSTHPELDASQFNRNRIYLLAATERNPKGRKDIGRGLLVAAPGKWFKSGASKHRAYLTSHYGSLAKTFKITLGEIHTDRFA